jgi:hypothetical protein
METIHPGVTGKKVEPLLVRPRDAWRMLGCGNTYGYELLNSGELDSFFRRQGPQDHHRVYSSIHRAAAGKRRHQRRECTTPPPRPAAQSAPDARMPCMNAPVTSPLAVDLLNQAIERVRPFLSRREPLKTRVCVLWAATKNARGFAAADVLASEFLQLARDTGLVADLDDPVRGLSGHDTVWHVVSWACLGINPFETGPLQ